MPEREQAGRFGTMYLDPLVLASPTLALVQASRESLRSADIVQEMLTKALTVLMTDDRALQEKVELMDDDVDLLDREVKLFLTKLSRESLSEGQAGRERGVKLFFDSMESIGDVIAKHPQ